MKRLFLPLWLCSLFPTHILLDANGKISKVTNAIDDLIPTLKNEVAKTSFNKP